ncbi:MAG: extracellular solute-binding protein, partial [Dehalococcoidia bacterium]|nr:extracellular solute-binding protein [Dehalococcoidia bacterium]
VPLLTSQDTAWEKVIDAARKEGKITLYTYSFTGDIGLAVSRGFQQRYGISVELVTGIGTVLIERIKSEVAANKHIADTIDTAAPIIATAKALGITSSVGDIPALREKDVWHAYPALDVEAHMLGLEFSAQVPFINTSQVSVEQAPRSYMELLEPRWKGKKVGIASPETTPNFVWVYALRKPLGLPDDYFAQMGRQDLRIYATVRDMYRSIVTGEIAVLAPGSMGTLAPDIAKGAPIRPIEPKEGAMADYGNTIAPVKNGPHPNATRLFINWLLSVEGQTVFHQAKSNASVRKDVPDFTPEAGRLQIKKSVPMNLAVHTDTSRIMRDGELSRIMGLVTK